MEFFAQYGLHIAFLLLTSGAIISLALGALKIDAQAWILAHFFAIVSGLSGILFALSALFSGTSIMHLQGAVGIAPDILTLRVDGLAAFFILAISLVAVASSLFGLSLQSE